MLQGIVVKIVTPSLGQKYLNKKGVIENVDEDYQAVVRTLSTGHKLKIDQAYLQTVIPQCGKLLLAKL
jgi:DNA/RNA-binding protein KIN17